MSVENESDEWNAARLPPTIGRLVVTTGGQLPAYGIRQNLPDWKKRLHPLGKYDDYPKANENVVLPDPVGSCGTRY